MTVRKEKKNRKYLGSRRWGVGNIKNARGKGDRGGVGNAGARKHKFTWMTAKAPELIRTVGFKPWRPRKLKEITLKRISAMQGDAVELKGYKVLSNGELGRAITIKADRFSETAKEKIKKAGGEAVELRQGK